MKFKAGQFVDVKLIGYAKVDAVDGDSYQLFSLMGSAAADGRITISPAWPPKRNFGLSGAATAITALNQPAPVRRGINEHRPYGCIGEWSERIAVA
ncbi:TPA: hypothetical protein N2B23_005630 [Pseudomonas aeruginosa]|nr:hypothetical protein [Pseudomonas aeruginosa]